MENNQGARTKRAGLIKEAQKDVLKERAESTAAAQKAKVDLRDMRQKLKDKGWDRAILAPNTPRTPEPKKETPKKAPKKKPEKIAQEGLDELELD